jgi:hypothetical protein
MDVNNAIKNIASFNDKCRALADKWNDEQIHDLCDDIDVMVDFCEMALPYYVIITTHGKDIAEDNRRPATFRDDVEPRQI